MYADAREFFEAVRSASMDLERIRRELESMEERATALGGGGFDPRVRSTPAHDRMGNAVAALVDRETKLRAQQDDHYALIDRACALLYGTDNDLGLRVSFGWPADALYHHYLALRTWDETARILGYSASHVRNMSKAALDYVDAHGEEYTKLGIGFAT